MFVEKCMRIAPVMTSSAGTEPEVASLWSQNPSIGPCPHPCECRPNPCILFIQEPSQCYLSICATVCQMASQPEFYVTRNKTHRTYKMIVIYVTVNEFVSFYVLRADCMSSEHLSLWSISGFLHTSYVFFVCLFNVCNLLNGTAFCN
jgi:hypothetical protein